MDPDVEDDITLANDIKFRNAVLEYDEELVREQLARNYAFFGDDGMAKIRAGNVVVVGCGGVGSWAAVMLVRSYVPSRECILYGADDALWTEEASPKFDW